MGYMAASRTPFRTSVGSLFSREMGDIFDRFFGERPAGDGRTTAIAPALEVSESENEFIVSVELPGVTDKDVKVNFVGGTLFVRGEKKFDAEAGKDRRIHLSERVYGAFERALTLPTPVKADHIRAEFGGGILTITVPKVDEVKPREIEIRTAR